MKAIKWQVSPDGQNKWLLFLLVVIIQLGTLAYIGWRWHNIGVDGIPYQWQCVPRLEVSSFGTDYIRVVFPEDTTKWLDQSQPEAGQIVYVYISRDAKGVMEIEGASVSKPSVGGDYMNATVVSFQNGTVQFRVGFDRYRIAPEKSDGIYDINAGDNVIASVRMKKGEGVIEGIYVNGVPLEASSSGAAMDAARKTAVSGNPGNTPLDKKHIVESGMVPPKEE
jgi:hypothetical protein